MSQEKSPPNMRLYNNLLFPILIVLFLLFIANQSILCATTHKHVIQGNPERVKDGGRDAHHYEDGEHHSEFDHEAIIGSVKEAEEYDNLSPEESKKRLAILILKMDLNRDGFIDKHELKAWILRSFKKLAEEEATERFESIDENKDERITWQEYIMDTFGIEDENENKDENMYPNQEEEQKMISDDKIMFNEADLNNDSVLNSDEFFIFHSPEEHPQMLPLILKQTLRDKDENNDGFIDFKEFINEEGKNYDKEQLLVEKEKFDEEYDKNKDGILNGNEILSWVLPSNDELATDEVDHLFAGTDDDHDNRLSYNEILEHYDIFVGSEATDYGDHLQNIDRFNDEL